MENKIKSVKWENGKLEIVMEVSNEFLTEDITWYYTPAGNGHEEKVDADSAMNNTTGYLILSLLQATGKIDADVAEEMEQTFG
jgi:hypothetical protein